MRVALIKMTKLLVAGSHPDLAEDERLDNSRNATRLAICSPSTPKIRRPKN